MAKRHVLGITVALATLAGGMAVPQVGHAQLDRLNGFCVDVGNGGIQPRPPFSQFERSADGMETFIDTANALLPTAPNKEDPTQNSLGPNPLNLLPTVYQNARDCAGDEIPNTLPSTPENPYNLHPDPVVTPIDRTSPTDDLDAVFDHLEQALDGYGRIDPERIDLALDILEGRAVPGRVYSGFPLLHYVGGLKTKQVEPVRDAAGNVVGGEVVVNQIWYDSHIESDTNYLDTSAIEAFDVPWTIRYRVNVLNRGHEDFAPYAMFYDDPQDLPPPLTGARIPNVAMDQTFFPMEEGLRYDFDMAMPPARFYNLTYHWGWRIHPPRVQVHENLQARLGNGELRNFFEVQVFGQDPTATEEARLAAIAMIGDLAPAKRMWNAFREMRDLVGAGGDRYGDRRGGDDDRDRARGRDHDRHDRGRGPRGIARHVDDDLREELRRRGGGRLAYLVMEARDAFDDWQDRARLPSGIKPDPEADITLAYLNNTLYGTVKGFDRDAQMQIRKFKGVGDQVTVKLINGDYYPHNYTLVDFGGLRGWENTFHNTIPVGGAGPWFTFGRNHWWPNTAGDPGGGVLVPPAARPTALSDDSYDMEDYERVVDMSSYTRGPGYKPPRGVPYELHLPHPVADYKNAVGLGEHTVHITFNYEPSQRLRMYQFDAFHHDVAVWSIH